MWLLLFLVFGFPITSMIPFFLGVPSTPFNIGLRAIYAALALWLVIVGLMRVKRSPLSIGVACLLVFWIIYGVRLIYDMQFRGITYLDANNP